VRRAWKWLGLFGGVAAVCLVGWAAAERHRPAALNPTFRPEADDGLGRTVRLIDVRSIADLSAAMRAAYGRPVQVHWEQIEFAAGRQYDFVVPELDVANAFRLLNQQTCAEWRMVTWRTFPTHVEIGERSFFDKMELERREYDLSWAVSLNTPAPCVDFIMKRAVDLVVASVRSEEWEDNGGDVASVRIERATLIIDAPRDMHPEIARVLASFERAEQNAALRISR
jgi:hypothetical protein